jgi:large subunit ribosomal protein L15
MPLQRRLPKRGFKSLSRVEYQPVNVRDLSRVEAGPVTPELMRDRGLIRSLKKPVKILGMGEVSEAYQVTAHAFSATARSKIEEAGGSVTVLPEPGGGGKGGRASAVEDVEAGKETEAAPEPQKGEEASEAEDEQA